MDGKNFREIDLNAAEALRKMLSRKAWGPESIEKRGQKVSFSGISGGIGFTVFIPSGWIEGNPADSGKGEIFSRKIFVSPDNSGRIEVSAVKKTDQRLNAFSRDWLKSTGFSMVQQKWGETEGSQYYRAVSRNRDDNVMELYVIERDDFLIVLSGRTTRDKYNNLSRHMDEIFGSVKNQDKLSTASAVKIN